MKREEKDADVLVHCAKNDLDFSSIKEKEREEEEEKRAQDAFHPAPGSKSLT